MGMVLLFGLLVAITIGFFALQIWGRTAPPPELGTEGGVLRPCPESPNCVETRNGADEAHGMEPLALSSGRREDDRAEAEAALDRVAAIIDELPRARVTDRRGPYLAAEVRSRIFGFRDDVEFLVDEDAGVIHFRSASRLGYSDMGANRARMGEITRRWVTDSGN